MEHEHVMLMPVEADGKLEWACACGTTGTVAKAPKGGTLEDAARAKFRSHVEKVND